MKDTSKVTMTIGQLKRLIKESFEPVWLNNKRNGLVETTCYNIIWENDADLPRYIKGIYVPFYGYLKDNHELRHVYRASISDVLEYKYHNKPISFEWYIDDFGVRE